jgi:hypothetical protein
MNMSDAIVSTLADLISLAFAKLLAALGVPKAKAETAAPIVLLLLVLAAALVAWFVYSA